MIVINANNLNEARKQKEKVKRQNSPELIAILSHDDEFNRKVLEIKGVNMEEVKHYQINGRYKVQFERSAVKGQDGFKVEANGDDLTGTSDEAHRLYEYALLLTKPIIPEVK